LSSVATPPALAGAVAANVVRPGSPGDPPPSDESRTPNVPAPAAEVEHGEAGLPPKGTSAVAAARAGDALPRPEQQQRTLNSSESGNGELSASRVADVLTQFLPIDRAALDRAIDRFLEPFHSLGDELTDISGSTGLLPAVTVAAVAAVISETVVQWRRRRAGQPEAASGGEESDDLDSFTWLPESWSIAET
jgi:hypothetical protein